MRSYIKLTQHGEPNPLDGCQRHDKNFDLASVNEATFKLIKFRPLNVEGALDQFGESPYCCGQSELSNKFYKEIISVQLRALGSNHNYTHCDLISWI